MGGDILQISVEKEVRPLPVVLVALVLALLAILVLSIIALKNISFEAIMNLLKEPWIPVREGNDAAPRLITYRQLLCEDGDVTLALSRDDMEMACLQLLISLTQVIFTPSKEGELFQHIDAQLSEDEYQNGVAPLLEWFDLAHKKWPFMQVRGVEAKDTTAIQKLFGLPEGDGSHTFFNDGQEIRTIGLPAAAIALFNQASCSPNFGGGFKGGLRGVQFTTLVRRDTLSRGDNAPVAGRLRRLLWWNVLQAEKLVSCVNRRVVRRLAE